MTTSYLLTLFLFIVLQINIASIDVLAKLPVANMTVVYQAVIALLLYFMLLGFTHTVKANSRAKNYSYMCAVVTAVVSFAMLLLMLSLQIFSGFVIVLAVISITSAVNLSYVTYKNTKSYFM